MQNKFDDFNLEETLSSLVNAIQDVNLLARRLVAIIPQDMGAKFDDLIDSGVLADVENLVRDTEIDDLEVMTESGPEWEGGKNMTGDRIWAVINNHMTFLKGTKVELSGPFSNGNFTLSIDFSGANMTEQMVMIAIDPDSLQTDDLGFQLSLLDVIRRALLGKFTNFDRLNEKLGELTLEYLVLEHKLGPPVVGEVDKEISFLTEYTKLFGVTPKENFLRVAVSQRPLIKTKTLLSFSQYAENMALTDVWRNIAHLVIADEDKALIRAKLSDRGHYLKLDSPLLGPAEIVNITVHTLDGSTANERFIQGYQALISKAIEALFFSGKRGGHECNRHSLTD